jgi:hypothetical protein
MLQVSLGQCQTIDTVSDSINNWSVSVSIFVSFLALLLRYRFQAIVTLTYLSLSFAPWSEGGCLSSANLSSTDSVNPRAVLSRVRPRYRHLSRHRDRRYWPGTGIGIENRIIGTEGPSCSTTEDRRKSDRASVQSLAHNRRLE